MFRIFLAFSFFLCLIGTAFATKLKVVDITTGNSAWDSGTTLLAGAVTLMVENTGAVDVKLGFQSTSPTIDEAYLEPGQSITLSFSNAARPPKIWTKGIGAAGSVRVTAAVEGVTLRGDDGAAQVAAASTEVRSISCTVLHSDLTDTDGSETETCGSTLPAGARLLGHHSVLNTAFSGGAGAATMDCGFGSNTDGITDGRNIFTGGAVNDYGSGTNALQAAYAVGGSTFSCTFTSDTTTSAFTAGSVTNTFIYAVPAAQ